MDAKNRVRNFVNKRIMEPRLKISESWEQKVRDYPGAFKGNEDSPLRFNLPKELITLEGGHPPIPGFPRAVRYMIGCMLDIRKSVFDLDVNPDPGKKTIDPKTLEALIQYGKEVGADDIGFAEVPKEWIFRDTGIRFNQAIVLTKEMDKELMNLAPDMETAVMVFETYNSLGRVSNKIADWLRERGYASHAGHPLGGMALYPPMAQAAGLGWFGLNGLVITPDFGPRVRLAAVFTEIENLPMYNGDEHAWVMDFCQSCKRCWRECPAQAFYDTPKKQENRITTVLDNGKCFQYFANNHGCSVCIKVCPFHQQSYDKIKEGSQG